MYFLSLKTIPTGFPFLASTQSHGTLWTDLWWIKLHLRSWEINGKTIDILKHFILEGQTLKGDMDA